MQHSFTFFLFTNKLFSFIIFHYHLASNYYFRGKFHAKFNIKIIKSSHRVGDQVRIYIFSPIFVHLHIFSLRFRAHCPCCRYGRPPRDTRFKSPYTCVIPCIFMKSGCVRILFSGYNKFMWCNIKNYEIKLQHGCAEIIWKMLTTTCMCMFAEIIPRVLSHPR